METERDMVAQETGANGDLQPPDSRHAFAGCPIRLTAVGEGTESEGNMKHGEVASEAGGFFCAPDWVFDREDIDAHAKLTLLYLYRRADKDCRCFPSMGRASKDLGCSKPRVIESIKQLEAAGLVIVTRGKRADGGNAPNSYFLPIKPTKRAAGAGNALDRDGKPDCSGVGNPGLPEGHTVGEGHTYNNTNASPTGSALTDGDTHQQGIPSDKGSIGWTGQDYHPAMGNEGEGHTEDRHGVKGSTGKPAGNPVPPSLCKACCDAWLRAYGGVLNFGRVRRALKPLMALYDVADIARGFELYVTRTGQQFASPEAFVAKAGVWIRGYTGRGWANDTADDIEADAERAAREMRELLGG